jgi:hypothetical protein
MIRNIKVPFGELNIFPFFMDYDFIKKRPRGLSTKLSFFSYDKLYKLIEGIEQINDILFIKKETLYFKSGFFLVDYTQIKENPQSFVDKLKNMNINSLYLEKSDILCFEDIFANNNDFEIFMMEII